MTSPTPVPDGIAPDTGTLVFGDCELDRQRRELRRAGDIVALEPKVFDLLVFMATHPDRALSKDALQEAAWPGLVVSDSVFSQAIMKARRAVGDDGQQQAVIATVHGYGYRFVAEVEVTGQTGATAGAGDRDRDRPSPPDDATVPATTTPHGRWPRLTGAVPVLAVLATLALAIAWLISRSTGGDPTAIIAVLPSAQAVEGDHAGALSLMARALDTPGTLDVIPADRVQRLLATHGVASDDDAGVLALLHDAMGVQYLLRTDIQRRGEQWDTRAVLIDRDLRRTELDPGPGNMVAMVSGMGEQLSRTLGTRLRDQLPAAVMSRDEFANEAMARGLHALLAGDSSAAATLFESALSQDPDLLWARYELAQAHIGMQQTEQATALLNEVRERAPAIEPRLGGHALTSLGIMAWRSGDLDRAEALFLDATAIYEQVGHDHGMAAVLGNRGILAENRGDLDLAEELYGSALLRFRRAHDLVGEAAVYTNTSILARLRGRTTDAWRNQARAVALQRRLGVGSMLVLSLTNQAELEHDLGHFEQATQTLVEARQLAQANDDPSGLAGVDLAEARHALDRLDLSRAISLAGAARERYRELGHDPYEVRAGQLLALAQLHANQPAAADKVLRSLPAGAGKYAEQVHGEMLQAQVSAALANDVQPLLAATIETRDGIDDPLLAADADRTIAGMQWRAGEQDAAIERWRASLRALDAADLPRQRALLQTRLAAALIDRGDLEGAERLLASVENWNTGFVPASLQRLRLARAAGDTAAAARLAGQLGALPGAASGPLAMELAVDRPHGKDAQAVPGEPLNGSR